MATIKRWIENDSGVVDSDRDTRQFVALYVTEDLGRTWRIIPTPFAFHNSTEDALTGFHDYRWPLTRRRRLELKPPREV